MARNLFKCATYEGNHTPSSPLFEHLEISLWLCDRSAPKPHLLLAAATIIFSTHGMTSFTRIAVLLIASLLIFSRISANASSANDPRSYITKAEQGDAEAQYRLGHCYSHGVDADDVEAVKWFRKAAEQGYAYAQEMLGYCYGKGKGVAKDPVEAVKWYRKAADQGVAFAHLMLGAYYHNGIGVAKDEVEEVKWYRKAPDEGGSFTNLGTAQHNLGVSYISGGELPKNVVEAYAFFNLLGLESSLEQRDSLANKMTPKQIAAAKKRTKELQKIFKK